jgi:hypothetical protein
MPTHLAMPITAFLNLTAVICARRKFGESAHTVLVKLQCNHVIRVLGLFRRVIMTRLDACTTHVHMKDTGSIRKL